MGNFVDAWYPATSDFGLIEAPLASVVATFVRWQAGIGKAPVESRQPSLESTFAALAPLSAELRRAAFVPTKSGWTAYFASGLLGSDPFPVMSYLAPTNFSVAPCGCAQPTPRRGGRRRRFGRYTRQSPSAAHHRWGYLRSVSCANDGGRWTFETVGSPFPLSDSSATIGPKKGTVSTASC